MIKVYIPTLGRTTRQETAKALAAAGVPYALVCRPEEAKTLSERHPVMVEPANLPRGCTQLL